MNNQRSREKYKKYTRLMQMFNKQDIIKILFKTAEISDIDEIVIELYRKKKDEILQQADEKCREVEENTGTLKWSKKFNEMRKIYKRNDNLYVLYKDYMEC